MKHRKLNKTINSAIWYTLSNVLAKAMTVLLTPIFARLLTTKEYGIYTNFVSWQNVLVILFSLEMSSTVLRAKYDYSEKEFDNYVFSICCFSIIFPFVTVGMALILGKRWLENAINLDFKLIVALYIIITFYSMIQIFQAEQRARVKYKMSSLMTVIFSGGTILLPIVCVYLFENKLYAITFATATNYLIFGIIFFVIYFKKANQKRIQIKYIKYALIIALPIVPHLLSSVIMGNSDKMMISQMCGVEYAARYGVVYTTALVVTLLRNSLNNAWIPWLYDKLTIREYEKIKQVSKIFIVFFSVVTFFLCLIGPELVLILGGKKYSEAAGMVPFIMIGCYFNFLNLFYVNIEFFEKKTFMISVITIITAILNVVLNYVGIKLINYQTAAIATAICNGITVISHYFVTRKWNNHEICDNKLIMCCALGGALISPMFQSFYNWNIFARILIIIIYILTLGIICVCKKNEIKKIMGEIYEGM